MDTTATVSMMCREELSAVDIQAIFRSRGLSPKDAASPRLLENLLLSAAGLPDAFVGLSREEILLLHFMTALSRPADVTFFERVYGASQRGSFTDRYRETFKNLRIVPQAGFPLDCLALRKYPGGKHTTGGKRR